MILSDGIKSINFLQSIRGGFISNYPSKVTMIKVGDALFFKLSAIYRLYATKMSLLRYAIYYWRYRLID